MSPPKSGKKAKPRAREAAAHPRTAGQHPQRCLVAGVCAVLVLACVAIYGQTLTHDFTNYDDNHYVTENPHVQAGLTADSIRWAFVTEKALYIHPLTWLSHMLDCTLYGMQPWGHHLTNLVFHAAASVLLFLALRFLTGALWQSAAVAALFAVHPLHVESVAWVAERKDVLSAFFWMLALWAYGLYVRRGGVLRYAAVAAAFILGLMSKPMVVTLPCVLLLLDYWPLDLVDRGAPLGQMAQRMGRLALWKAPLFLITVLSAASTYIMQAGGNNLSFGEKVSLVNRCANAVVVYVLYLVKTACPFALAAFYPHPITRPLWQVAGAAVILAAVTLFCLREIRRRPYLIVGWLWYLGTLVPVIELVQAGDFSHADRYTYLPSIGVFIMVAWGVADLAAAWKVPRRAVAVASVAALAALTVCAAVQTSHWKNSKTLFLHAIAVGHTSALAFDNVAAYDMERGDYDEARDCLTKALEINPKDLKALNNLGLAAMSQGRNDEARAWLEKALALRPDQVSVLTNLAKLAKDQNRHDEARTYLEKALELDPASINALNNMGDLAMDQQRYGEARNCLEKALRVDPKNTSALTNMGKLNILEKRYDEARACLEKALQRDPDNVNVLNNLGGCLLYQEQYEEAQRYLRRALEIDPKSVSAMNNLSYALTKMGRQEEAAAWTRKAAEAGK